MLQTTGSITAASGPKFTILWGDLKDILLLNKFFPIVDTCLSCEDIARQICVIVRRWQFLATVSCICCEPCAARFRHASEIRTKATPCVEVWQTSNLRRLRLGEERKKEDRKQKPQGKNIMVCPIPLGDHNYRPHVLSYSRVNMT